MNSRIAVLEEVKTLDDTEADERERVREALGQLLYYDRGHVEDRLQHISEPFHMDGSYKAAIDLKPYTRQGSRSALWDTSNGGSSFFGALFTFGPACFVAAGWLDIPAAVFYDHMAIGVLAGGFWVRLGCAFNGCCVGRQTTGMLSVCLHDMRGVRKARIPVQFMEMAWLLVVLVALLLLWSLAFRPGSYALAALAWYGVGRFFLEPLREQPDTVFSGVRINQVVAALLTMISVGALVMRG